MTRMNINITETRGKMTVALGGRLDTNTAPELEEKLGLEGVTDLRFDLSSLEYISSAGLRVLLSAQKTMNNQGRMTITGCSEDILEIFEITGFTDILNIQ